MAAVRAEFRAQIQRVDWSFIDEDEEEVSAG
jgi:hypothetical protein